MQKTSIKKLLRIADKLKSKEPKLADRLIKLSQMDLEDVFEGGDFDSWMNREEKDKEQTNPWKPGHEVARTEYGVIKDVDGDIVTVVWQTHYGGKKVRQRHNWKDTEIFNSESAILNADEDLMRMY